MMRGGGQDRVVLDVERILSHQIAHSLNNALGAIGVLADMITEDVQDPDIQKRLSKMTLAAEVARAQVTALRYAVPRPDQVGPAVPYAFVRETVGLMLGDLAVRLTADGDARSAAALMKGERSIMVLILSTLTAHVLGAVRGGAHMTAALTHVAPDGAKELFGTMPKGEILRIDILADAGNVNDLMVDEDLWSRMVTDQGAMVVRLPAGFSVMWPLAAG